MELYDFNDLVVKKVKRNKDILLTIGVFEAFHKGHQAIMESLLEEKRLYPNSETMTITFSTNPKPGREGAIDTLRLREENLALYEIDSCITIDFSQQFSKISAREFLEMILSSMNLKAIVVGEDFRFGNPSEAASAYDLVPMLSKTNSSAKVKIVAPILMEGGEKISSTLLRKMIKDGKLEEFPKLSSQYYTLDLLERPYSFDGGKLAYRTEDIHQLLPPQGVYEGKLILKDKTCIAVELEIKNSSMLITSVPDKSFSGNPMFKIEKLLLEKRK